VSWFFADVQQSLRIGLFSLVSYHRCSPLFAWVGVSRRRLQTTKNRSRTSSRPYRSHPRRGSYAATDDRPTVALPTVVTSVRCHRGGSMPTSWASARETRNWCCLTEMCLPYGVFRHAAALNRARQDALGRSQRPRALGSEVLFTQRRGS
jgi:hypothetical protein